MNAEPFVRPADFNPRAREGRDLPHRLKTRSRRYFNPRAREGRDVVKDNGADLQQNFNPRAREGRDFYASELYQDDDISIHAPVKGATDRKMEVKL